MNRPPQANQPPRGTIGDMPARFPAVVRPTVKVAKALDLPTPGTQILMMQGDGTPQLANYVGPGPLPDNVEQWIALADIGTGKWNTRIAVVEAIPWRDRDCPANGERFDAFNEDGTPVLLARTGTRDVTTGWAEAFNRMNVALWYYLPAVPDPKLVVADIATLRRVAEGTT